MSQVRERIEGKVGVIELFNPPRNFMTAEMVRELDEVIRRWERDPAVRAVVVTGGVPGIFITHYSVEELTTGFETLTRAPDALKGALRLSARLFSKGYRLLDLLPPVREAVDRGLAGTPLAGMADLERVHRLFMRLELMDKPVVAAINGEAMGGGCELALACDYRIMARGDYRIGLIEALAGIIPGAGGTQRMARLLGPGKAVEMMLDGWLLDPEEAEKVGLVSWSVDERRLMEEAMGLASRLAARPAASVRGIKRAVRLGADLPIARGIEIEKDLFVATGLTDDAKKGGELYLELFGKGTRPRDIFEVFRKGKGVDFGEE